MAPFTHTYCSPQGSRRLCCASRESAEGDIMKQYIDIPSKHKGVFDPNSLKNHWNSEHMKSVRKRMMAGEELPECQICNDQILNLHTYRQYFTGTLFPHLIQKAIENTAPDGYTEMEPISFDYRLSNLCNFKCRMCGPPLSSSWEAERRKYKTWDAEKDPWMVPNVRNVIQEFQEEILERELEDAIDRKVIREIYWVGGEPLMWDAHWRLMEKMIKNKSAQNIVVRYNTNLSRVNWKGKNIYHDYLLPFKKVNICASLDATGKIGEFIRTGLNWEEWKSNWEQGQEWRFLQPVPANCHPDFLVVDLTLTLPGLFGLVDLVKFANYCGSKIYTKIMFAFDPCIVLSPFALPRDLLDSFLDDLIQEIEPLTNSKNNSVLDTLKEMKTRLTFAEEWPDIYEEEFLRGKGEQARLAEYREDGKQGRLTIEDIYSARPEILGWWNGQ